MANVINELLANTKNNNAAFALSVADKAVGHAIETGDKAIEGVRDNLKQKAISRVLQTDGAAYMNADLYQDALTKQLSGIDGIDPVLALNLGQRGASVKRNQEARQLAASQRVEDQRIEQQKTVFDQGYKTAQLVQESDQQTATQDYRTQVLDNTVSRNAEVKRHNKVIETPSDIREAYQANYATGVKQNEDGTTKKYLTQEDFAKYQKDKAKAKFSQRVLDPSTIDKNKASVNKSYDDILYKQLGEDGYKAYNRLPAAERTEMLDYWLDNGIIDFSMTDENTFSSDDYGQGEGSKGYQRQAVETTPVSGKEVLQTFPDGSVLYDDGTTGTP